MNTKTIKTCMKHSLSPFGLNTEPQRTEPNLVAIDAVANCGAEEKRHTAQTVYGTNWTTNLLRLGQKLKRAIKREIQMMQLNDVSDAIICSEISGHPITKNQYVRETIEREKVKAYGFGRY